MCLQFFAVPAEPGRVSARRLAQVSGLKVTKLNTPEEGALWFSVDGGCSCSLMADDADWSDQTWKLESKVLSGLAAACELLDREANGFTLQAYWIGERPEARVRVALREVLADIHENRVRNKHVYVVGKAA
jgi:hypothetical protein